MKDISIKEFETEDLNKRIRPIIYFSLTVIIIGIIGFGIWGGFAPLDSASVAEGHIAVSGDHKVIQHLEGGVIEKILIQEGNLVSKNQPLIILKDTEARAKVKRIAWQLAKEKAVEERLAAEEQGLENINFTAELSNFAKQDIQKLQKIQEIQRKLFKGRKEKLATKLAITQQRASQCSKQIVGLRSQMISVTEQLKSLNEELIAFQKLRDKGYVSKEKIWQVRRGINEMEARKADIQAKIYVTIKEQGAVEIEMMHLKHEFTKEIFTELQEVHGHILELKEQLKAVEDVLQRMVIRAPQSGVVTDLKYHTEGGVIGSGQKVMDIVPENGRLIVEAKVRPQDIESIKEGLIAKVQLNAYKNRLVPRLSGIVEHISPDRLQDESTKTYYYLARIKIPDAELTKLKTKVNLYPGMPATVYIVKGTRTVLQYLLSPLTESFQKAFKEQ